MGGGKAVGNVITFELWGWLSLVAFLLLIGYFMFKLWVWPATELSIDPDQTFIIGGQKYKLVKVDDDHETAG